jgi:hypothetical protein
MMLETTSTESVEYSRKGLRLSEAGPVTERRWRSWNVSRDRGKALKKFLCNLADCSDRGPPSGRRSQLAVEIQNPPCQIGRLEIRRRQAARSGHPQSDGERGGRRG